MTARARIEYGLVILAAVGVMLIACGDSSDESPAATPTVAPSGTIALPTLTPPPEVPLDAADLPPQQVYVLLADNRLVALSSDDPAEPRFEVDLGPGRAEPVPGARLALRDGALFVLVPAAEGEPDRLVRVDTATGRAEEVYAFGDVDYGRLAIGPASGWLYAFGTTAEGDLIVSAVDPATGGLAGEWRAGLPEGRDWLPIDAAVSEDERRLYVSYHGTSTTGMDWFDIEGDRLVRCDRAQDAGSGCLFAHGGIELLDDALLAATGTAELRQYGLDGTLLGTFDSLRQGHTMELAVEPDRSRAYVLDSCGYLGGVSEVDLESGASRTIAEPASGVVQQWTICGERMALGPGPTLVIGRNQLAYAQPDKPGVLQFVDVRTGGVLHIDLPSEPVDLLVAEQ